MPNAIETRPGHTEDTESDHRLPKAEVFDILSADRRQEVLKYLDQTDGTVTLGELAEHIASLECNCEVRELSSQQRKRVYVGLYQCHLPKMAEAGVIEFDSDRKTIAATDRTPRLLKYLYLEDDTESTSQGLVSRFFG